jgi:hypothetical protein
VIVWKQFEGLTSGSLRGISSAKIMTGYSGTPLWRKLGYKNDLAAFVEGAPDDYWEWLDLPPELSIRWVAHPEPRLLFVHLFVTDAAKLGGAVKLWRKKIAPDGVVWVSWPKKTSGVKTNITEQVIRDVALPTGLVDIKICAVNDVWSGLKLMIRKELRASRKNGQA